MIQVYGGDGKGKTTAAVGLCARAAGHGFSVLFIQFLKDDNSGEVSTLRTIPGVSVVHCPINYGFTFNMTETQKKEVAREYDKIVNETMNSDAFLIVLDEVIHALNAGMVERTKIEKLLEKECEIVLTGRNVPEWLINRADYVSIIRKIKHPYDHGARARAGIEF